MKRVIGTIFKERFWFQVENIFLKLKKDIDDLGGGWLLHAKYNGSIYLMLFSVYPDYEWLPWKFAQSPKFFWEDVKNQRQFMDWAGKQLGVESLEDWYNVSARVSCIGYTEYL